nr:putative ribonuclease H-like domain-containing protein [Tanacetum cinerariifolium]
VEKKVKIIRCDNGTEFKNRVMNEFYEERGIKREYSVARTPQQNGVAERRNRTLIKAARTMLADFKLADESQVLFKVPRKNNMYSFDMKNIVPQKYLTCLLAKATNDESMIWHRRLGHINFKNIDKLVNDNLVTGLPSKRFENDQTCVACLKGKQHKVSFKSKLQNSISQPLFMLHMDLFSRTS